MERVERATLHVIPMSEKHKLHNVRLDDEVWAAVKAMKCSLNQYLRTALLDHPLTADSMIKLATPARYGWTATDSYLKNIGAEDVKELKYERDD